MRRIRPYVGPYGVVLRPTKVQQAEELNGGIQECTTPARCKYLARLIPSSNNDFAWIHGEIWDQDPGIDYTRAEFRMAEVEDVGLGTKQERKQDWRWKDRLDVLGSAQGESKLY